MKHKQINMEYLVSCVAFFLLFLAYIIPSEAAANSIKPNYDFDSNKVFDIRGHLIISCNVSLTPERPYVLDWQKDGKPVSEDSTLTNRYKILSSEDKFVIDRTIETDAGNYTCKITNSTDPALSANIEVLAKPFVKLAPNTGVVEGERLRILCNVYGKPVPNVEWQIENDTYKESRDRVELLPSEAGIPNSVLLIAEVKLEDRGTYTCRASSIASRLVNATQAETFVRVKDRLAALWPFLGICTEVFVLCAIILVYEKRRSKPELDESDVDQSPDQKHSSDQEKDPDVRQRK